MNPIEDIAHRTGWQQEVVKHLFEGYLESGQSIPFDQAIANAIGSAAFITCAAGGGDILACLQAFDVGIECCLKGSIVDVEAMK